ncbi:EAL domain-containing protein [Permianibacter sp. IMCC34836]|uniref:putative bifunctional diguanylate cyclase/phosphodiesterase n=1 Tax=Permianibacter fluminis TaxID=2738515 RepID=UPI0015528CB6|nr:EAL domain-containing protein [Permianibacter fluminis]NQD38509.1 EAL domain-containing protein [Permianibacter fluminis]
MRALSLRAKLISIIVLVSTLAIGLGLVALGFYQQRAARNAMLENVSGQARLMALYSEVPLNFSDRSGLLDVLNKGQLPSLLQAAVYTSTGELFATIQRDSRGSLPASLTMPVDTGMKMSAQQLELMQPIGSDPKNPLGYLAMQVSLSELNAAIRDGILLLLLIGAALIGVSFLLAVRLQRYVSGPILNLARLTTQVSARNDFSLRAPVQGEDEIGRLARGFNHMLDVIGEREQARDRAEGALRDSKETLEQAVQELHHLANYDALTELPNRSLCMDRIANALMRASREHDRVAIIFLDLDHFKEVNDSLGHAIGDDLLKSAASRLQDCLRRGDTLARLGGDEFVLVLEELHDDLNVITVLNKIISSFSEAFHIGGYVVSTTVSMGVAIYPSDGRDVHTLMRNADTAMYKAKELGRNTYQFYQPDMNALSLRRLSLATELREALQYNQLELYYQPQLDTRSKRIVGVEALLRWKHPVMGSISPAEFIPIAESTGLIVPIGQWVIERAARQLADWRKQGIGPLRVAVNISAVQFRQVDLAEQIARTVSAHNIPPESIELELTESLLMRDVESATNQLKKLKALGFKLVIDDFGTGYSSLSYLRRFPLDGLKIDRSFIDEVNRNPDDTAITLAILSMARSLRLMVIAEGVETREQYEFLLNHDCEEVQGYLFSPPVPEPVLTPLLKQATPNFPRLQVVNNSGGGQ